MCISWFFHIQYIYIYKNARYFDKNKGAICLLVYIIQLQTHIYLSNHAHAHAQAPTHTHTHVSEEVTIYGTTIHGNV
jgi:hypothetical protein